MSARHLMGWIAATVLAGCAATVASPKAPPRRQAQEPPPQSPPREVDQSLPKGAVGRLGKLTAEFLDRVLSVDASLDGSKLLVGREDGSVECWNLKEFKLLRGVLDRQGPRQDHQEQRAECVRFLPDGTRCLIAGSRMGIRLVNVENGESIWRVEGDAPCALSPDGTTFASAGRDSKEIVLRQAGTGEEIVRLRGHLQSLTSLDFSPDGKSLVSGSFDRTVRRWNLASGKEEWRHGSAAADLVIGPEFPHRVRVSPSGKRIAATYHGCWMLTCSILSFESGRLESETPLSSSDDLVFLSNSDVIAFHGTDDRICLLDLDKKALARRSRGPHQNRVFSILHLSDDRIISAGDWGNILIWDPREFEPVDAVK